MSQSNSKAQLGNFFEDFKLGQTLHHATPRTITEGDVAMYNGFTGSRFLLSSSSEACKSIGHSSLIVDDILVFHIAFGKTVADVSFNAVANLGYANIRFEQSVNIGDTLNVSSTVIGLRENKNGKSGIVYVESIAKNQHGHVVLSWNRWVMVHKNDLTASVETHIPETLESVDISSLSQLSETGLNLDYSKLDLADTGSTFRWNDYEIGERIDHVEGMTIDNSDHTLATKLYQNNARVHFDHVHMQSSQFQQRLIYGGHIISICRALSFNGLGNALNIVGINAGSHTSPTFAGDTIYACTEITDKIEIAGRDDIAALRLKTWGVKNQASQEIDSFMINDKQYADNVVLSLDYTALILK